MKKESQPSQADFRETAFNYIAGEKTGTFYTGERKWINRLKKLAEENPEQVKVLHENDDGSILVEAPVRGFRYSLPKPRVMSEEQKQAASERFKKMWEDKRRTEEQKL